MVNTVHAIPPKVQAAIDHVRKFHPEIVQVTFSKSGQWIFGCVDGHAPTFHKDIDTNIIEEALNEAYELHKLPTIYFIEPPEDDKHIDVHSEAALQFNDYFLVGTHYAYDIGKHANLQAARNSDECARMGGPEKCLVLNRAEAHEVMRQLKLKLSFYDNSMLKQ